MIVALNCSHDLPSLGEEAGGIRNGNMISQSELGNGEEAECPRQITSLVWDPQWEYDLPVGVGELGIAHAKRRQQIRQIVLGDEFGGALSAGGPVCVLLRLELLLLIGLLLDPSLPVAFQ